MEGDPLETPLTQGPMPTAEVVSLAREVLAALGAVHDAGLQHLGLRPGEVFLEAGLDALFNPPCEPLSRNGFYISPRSPARPPATTDPYNPGNPEGI